MNTYIRSTITFRNHDSRCFSDFCYLNERLDNCACGFSFNDVSLYPKVFYGLRQSTLIHCSASRRFLGGYGVCRLFLDNDHGYKALCPFKRRERRFSCLVWEKETHNEELGLGFDVGIEEILSLLVEGEESVKDSERRDNTRSVGRKSQILVHDRIGEEIGKFMAKGSKRIEIQKGGFCKTKKKSGIVGNVGVRNSRNSTIMDGDVGGGNRLGGGVDSTSARRKNSRQDDICGGSDLFHSNLESKCTMNSTERYRYSERQNSSRTDNHKARKEGSDEYCSTSLLGDSNNQLFLTSNRAISTKKNTAMVTALSNRDNNTQMQMNSVEHGLRGRKVIDGYSMGISSRGGCGSDFRQVSISGEKQFQKHDNYRSCGDSSIMGKTALKERTATGSMKQKARARSDEMEYNAHVSLATSKSDDNWISPKQFEMLKKTTARDKKENSVSVDWESRGQVDQTEQQVTGKCGSSRHDSQLCSMDLEFEVGDRSERYTAEKNYFSETDQFHECRNGQMDARNTERRSSEAIWMPPTSQPVVRGSTEPAKQKVRASRDAAEYNASISLATHESDAQWFCGKQSKMPTKTTVKDKGENSVLIMTQDRESRDLLGKTEQQVIGKRGLWRQDNRLHSVDSEIEVLDEPERYSSQQDYFSETDQLYGSGTGQIVRGSIHTVSDSEPIASTSPEAFIEPARSGSGVIYAHGHGKMPVTPHELDNRIRRDESSAENLELVKVTDDAMTSASFSEKTSMKFVGEFVDKLHQELLTSHQLQRASKHTFETEMETATLDSHQSTLNASTVFGDEKSTQHGSSKMISEKFHSKGNDLRRISGGFETKGPSDEIWDVAGPSSQEPSGTEAPKKGPVQITSGGCSTEGSSTLGNAIARRSSQSLWSYIAEMIRKGLGARVESNNATLKLGTRTASTESGSSEAWFSGHEPDDDENVMKEKNGITKESLPVKNLQDKLYPSQEDTSFEDRNVLAQVEATSTSRGALVREPLLTIAPSFVSGTENFGSVENRSVVTLGSSLIAFDNSSSAPIRHSTIDSNKLEISESSKITVPSSGFNMEMGEGSSRERLNETARVDGKERELKQRKFSRNKQVQKERFEEWEEAFKLESEQRKTDEMFMREAVLEAKKAADTWEVPVGAVLVQDGKIIARGFNLVEKQRDSTAHAEMICIREASNLLRTWRLAGMTLYVTLEPCPMCAGAILQARIDTVVWGAPNKLLGADGSWISLFPSKEDERNNSDQSNRMAAPVHPFHPNMTIRRGVLANGCSDVMQQFFQLRRKKKKPEPPSSGMPVSNYPSKFFTKMHNIFSMIFCL